jgi:hypothetical protein
VRLAIAIAFLPVLAHAERRLNDLHDMPCAGCVYGRTLIRLQTNANRIELGIGASAGWRDSLDIHVRYHATDRWSLAYRERVVRDHELELAYVLGRGKMLLPGELLTRADLVLDSGGGLAGTRAFPFTGARLRFQPTTVSMLAIELGVRESWVPLDPTAAARTLSPQPDRGFVTEVMASVAIMWPFERHERVWR